MVGNVCCGIEAHGGPVTRGGRLLGGRTYWISRSIIVQLILNSNIYPVFILYGCEMMGKV
jgi:hypothetical protein